jgi:sec-independent protein translocase protein TatA
MNLGAPEIIGIIVLALLLFGSRKLPELGSSVGKTITNFKQGIADAKEEEAEAADAASAPASTTTTEPVTTPPTEVVDQRDRA